MKRIVVVKADVVDRKVEVEVRVKAVEELKVKSLKLLLCGLTAVLFLFSASVFADQEFVGESEALEVEATTGTTMRCTMDLNQWGHSSNCQCAPGEYYNPKVGECRQRHHVGHKPIRRLPPKPQFTRCTKDLNQWGHSGNCHCALADHEYDERIGRCVAIQEQSSVIAGCEDAVISENDQVVTCQNSGWTFERVEETADEFAQELGEHLAAGGEGGASQEGEETYFPQPFAGVR